MAKREFSRRTERIEELITRIESSGDPAMRAVASELLQAVVELHGIALERICLELVERPGGQEAIDRLAEEELIAGVLSLHGIHPQPLETRVAGALEEARPYLRSHGGDVELAGITEGVVRLRLHGACGHCSGSAQTMKSTVEEAIYRAAPEVASVITEEVAAPAHSELVALQVS
ncbi:MAG TPA: NifU family protein [Acidobacteriaceae bacterium]|jgi:Fe-S cluster biogenesis protein NfuA|nr:NifU family protein [Acidobacteriaceae bacterium]